MRLSDYLKANRITQAEFGRLLVPPVSQGKVNHWLQGTRRVSLAEALQIVELSGGDVDMRSLAAMANGSSLSLRVGNAVHHVRHRASPPVGRAEVSSPPSH